MAKPKRFNFFALCLGAIIADLEVPIPFLFNSDPWQARGLMHSLMGAVSLNLVIVVLATIYLVPSVLNFMDKKGDNKAVFLFAGNDLRNNKTSGLIIVYSCLIGALSHLFLDALHHPYNPITFPFEKYYDFNLIMFGNHQLSNVLIGVVTITLFLIMFYYWYVKGLLNERVQGVK
jgi:hypothetical protein